MSIVPGYVRQGRALAPGSGEGPAIVLREGLSFWGGIDADTGEIIDRAHPDLGRCVAGRVLVMPSGRGSSSSSSVLAETLRRGTGPSAILVATADPILTVGALVAGELYGVRCPVVVCDAAGIRDGDVVRVQADARSARIEMGDSHL